MFTTLILILILCGAFALVWWGFSKIGLPEPVRTIVLVILGLIALAFIYNIVVSGGLNISLR